MQPSRGLHWPSVLQFLYSGAGLAFWWGAAFLVLIGAAFGLMGGAGLGAELNPGLLTAVGLGFAGILFVPPLVYAFLRVLEKPVKTARMPRLTPLVWGGIFLVWAVSIALGSLLSRRPDSGRLLLAPLYILGVGLPVLVLVLAATHGLVIGSPQRGWGLLSTGMLLSPAVVTSIQIVLGLVAAAALAAYFASQPDAGEGLALLAQRIVNAGDNPEVIQRILRSYLSNPGVIFVLLAYLAGFTPLLEELFKTAGIWLAGRRVTSPGQGFAGGALCGAGFALVESLSASGSAVGESWAGITLARAGTDLLHILTGALMGWAIASAWGQGRYLRLFLTYLGVVVLHGLWNAFSVATGILPILNVRLEGLSILGENGNPGTLALASLSLLMLVLLITFNRRLRLGVAPPSDTPEGPADPYGLPDQPDGEEPARYTSG